MKVAIVQWEPVHLDLPASVDKALEGISVAAGEGAELIVFGESWFSGYPAWLDHCPEIGFWNHPPMKKIFGRMIAHSLQREGEEMKRLCQQAKELNVALVFGANEYDPGHAKGTLFNSLFTINHKGQVINHHRKLVPTYTEKLLHAPGDGHGLVSVPINGARVTGLICWEHWMPLSRQTLHDSGEDIHIAAWPNVHEMHQVASRQYAFEGRCFVLAAGLMYHSSRFPNELEKPAAFKEKDQWVLNGGSCIIGPDGKYIVEPQFDVETILYADLNLQQVREESLTLDVSGHYQRKDVFRLSVNRDR